MTIRQNRIYDAFSLEQSMGEFLQENPEILARSKDSIVVLNPYLPSYRLKFFTLVQSRLSEYGFKFTLLTGNPDKQFLARKDLSTAPFHITESKVSLRIFDHTIRYLFVGNRLRNASAVVYEYSITNLNTWLAILLRKRHKVILWGHGPGYLGKKSKVRKALELFMARRADRVLLYTKPGKERLIHLGIEDSKVDYLNNSFDWLPIESAIRALDAKSIKDFTKKHMLVEGKVFAFIGAIDSTKRIDFLVQVIDRVWLLDQEVRFLVAGEGTEKSKLEKAVERGQVILLGRIGSSDKALIGSVARGLVNPGNIGLLAVDAMVLGLPIFGTNVESSPEKDYLEEGLSLFTLPNTPKEFGDMLITHLSDTKARHDPSDIPSVGDFADRFSTNLRSVVNREMPSVLFLTNLPAPYRVSLFNELSEFFNLKIGFTGWREEGRNWRLPKGNQVKFETVKAGWLLGLGRFKVPIPTFGLSKLIRESDLVIAGGWNSTVYLLGLWKSKRYGIRSAIWFESTLNSALFKSSWATSIRRMVFRLAKFAITPGPAASEAVVKYTDNSLPIFQVSNPVDTRFFGPELLRSDSKGIRFLYFGRLIPLKRVDLLIDAFAAVSHPGDTLTIVGDGESKNALTHLASQSSAANRVTFLPSVAADAALEVYRDFDVLVLPSNREVWGMVIPEALLRGLNVVVADNVGCVSSFKDFQGVTIFKTDSLSDLERAIIQSRKISSLSKEENARLVEMNSPTLFASKFDVFYRSALGLSAQENDGRLS